MLHIFQSNRLEILADDLERRLREARGTPLATQTIIVQERALSRWLSLSLAERFGVAANIAYPFPAAHLWSLFGRVLKDLPAESPFDPAVLRWHCMKWLESAEAARHPRLQPVLAGGTLRRHEFAQRLAALFDRYLVYRPDWIDHWHAGKSHGLGEDEVWQAALWREIAAATPATMRAHPAERFFATLADNESACAALPRHLHLFALQALPPMYLNMYARLAEWTEVHLYALNPCEQQWGDIVRRREQALKLAQAGEGIDLHLEIGNNLLASLGRHGRAFFDALSGLSAAEESDYRRNEATTLLALLQNDVLDLHEREETQALAINDHSVQVHVCHSAMREIEVLHDRLLDAFQRDPSLRASDVLVLVPKIENYAAAIDAVFATAPPQRRLPYVIADRPPQKGSAVLRSFMQLLRLPETRLEAESVLSFLEEAPIARRQSIVSDDLPLLRQWVRETGIRWGYDEAARAALDLPAVREHSWGAGFDRLMLGYAMAEEELFDGILPYADIEGGYTQIAGRLKTFVDALAALNDELTQPRSLAQWRNWAERTLARLYDCDEAEERDAQAIRAAAMKLAVDAHRAGFEGAVPAQLWKRELAALLESAPFGQISSGGITFAALRPLRATPARFVAVLGLNDGEFPGNPPQASFDLMTRHPKPGDRQPRDEERYALLEAMLAARERLYLSYIGRSQRDNAELPPSPVLAEVLETIRRSVSGSERIVIEHPLQPFSRRYFNGELFSYASEYVQPGPIALSESPFIRQALPPLEMEPLIELEVLRKFLRNPAEYFLRERLGLRLTAGEEALEGSEPFELDALAQWKLCDSVLGHLLQGLSVDSSRTRMRAAGYLPHGYAGDALYAATVAQLRPLHRVISAAGPLQREQILLQQKGLTLTGNIEFTGEEAHVLWRVGKLGGRELLQAWVAHLALNAAGRM
ncbi:MAG TPA: exodeoxyribonuclease V subunit gamma, partial [Burkholderiales bacterium]|nr:exodeoxyribonuclease V subunit gamma [Burkholderiales bacterium]